MSMIPLSREQAAAFLEQNKLQLKANQGSLKSQEHILELIERAMHELDPKPAWGHVAAHIEALLSSQRYNLRAQQFGIQVAVAQLKDAIAINESNIRNLESPILNVGGRLGMN